MSKKNTFSSLEEKIQWLIAHPTFLMGRFEKQKAVLAMKRDGLFSKSTLWYDVNLDEAVRQAKARRKNLLPSRSLIAGV
jgi:hypothetical protein